MPSLRMSGANATMKYTANGVTSVAQVRVRTLAYNYGVTSTESHSREIRAFYPHRRAQGQFRITVDCIGYREFKLLMDWLRTYTTTMLSVAQASDNSVTLMDVSLPSRGFHKIGVLTTGIDDHDHVGATVFSQELVFATLMDPNDPVTSLLKTSQVSQFVSPEVNASATQGFYPSTVANLKDGQLYNIDATLSPDDVNQIVNQVNNSGGRGGNKAV